MRTLRHAFLGFMGASFGFAVAGGYLALISMIGVVPRLASKSETADKVIVYENCMIYGVAAGNICFFLNFSLPFGLIFQILTGLFGGIFTGCLAGALAEIVNVLPIFARRTRLRKGIPYIIYTLAASKAAGVLVQYFL